jgi:hypothetical protein
MKEWMPINPCEGCKIEREACEFSCNRPYTYAKQNESLKELLKHLIEYQPDYEDLKSMLKQLEAK